MTLSVRQPFASALVIGPKPGENRSWRPSWDRLRTGDWLAIHASVSLYVGARRLVQEFRMSGMWHDCPPLDAMPRDAVIGVVRLAGVSRAYDDARQGDLWASDDDDQFYWRFDERREFPTPIVPPPAKPMAHAGLWLAPGAVVRLAESMGCVNG